MIKKDISGFYSLVDAVTNLDRQARETEFQPRNLDDTTKAVLARSRGLLQLQDDSSLLLIGEHDSAEIIGLLDDYSDESQATVVAVTDSESEKFDLARRLAGRTEVQTSIVSRNFSELPLRFGGDSEYGTGFQNHFEGIRLTRAFEGVSESHIEHLLSELKEVLATKGRLVVAELDWGSLTIPNADRQLTELIKSYALVMNGCPRGAEQLSTLLQVCDYTNIEAEKVRMPLEYEAFVELTGIDSVLNALVAAQRIDELTAAEYLQKIKENISEARIDFDIVCAEKA